MVSNNVIISMIIVMLVCVLFPIGIFIYFKIKEGISIKTTLGGIIGFVLFALILEQILHKVVTSSNIIPVNTLAFGIYGALAAGVFEETGRFLVFKTFLKNKREWKDGLGYAIGHGGIEAILVGGLSFLNSLIITFALNSGTLKGENMLLIVISIAIGSLLGELINIDEKLILLGNFIENKAKSFSKDTSISLGFVTASLLFCVGAMAVVGSLESGLLGKYDILFTKSILDGVTSLILSSTLGIGVILSAFSVLVYQGLITLAASLLQNILTTPIVNEMSAVGSLLIIGIGLNMLGITKIKVANMLPAIFIPIIYGLFF